MIEKLRVRIPAGATGNFLLQSSLCVLTLIPCPFHPRVTAVTRKRPQSFCQKCRWQVTPKQAYTLDPTKSEWAVYAAVQVQCGNLSGNEFTRSLSGNIRPQSAQPAEPLWTDPGINCGINVRELISTSKAKITNMKKSQAVNEWSNILQKSSQARKKPPTPSHQISWQQAKHAKLYSDLLETYKRKFNSCGL